MGFMDIVFVREFLSRFLPQTIHRHGRIRDTKGFLDGIVFEWCAASGLLTTEPVSSIPVQCHAIRNKPQTINSS